MPSNATTVRGLRKNSLSFDQFDSLPPYIRDALNYAPTKVIYKGNASPAQFKKIYDDYLITLAKDTAKTYGPDHPQAWGNLAFSPEDFLD